MVPSLEAPRPGSIRLLAVDLDGTLMPQGGKRISAKNVHAIRAAAHAGVWVVPISARPPFGIEHPFRQSISAPDADEILDYFQFLIAYNGALILDRRTGADLFNRPIEPDDAVRAIQRLLAHHLYIACYIGDQYYVREACEEAAIETSALGKPPVIRPDLTSLAETGVHKLLTLDRNHPERLAPFFDEAAHLLSGLEVVYTSPYSVEITHPDVSKGTAVRHLAGALGIPLGQVMAVGDNYNDLTMFQAAGVSVAMGDSPVELQQTVGWVAPSSGEDGVAAAIERYILDPQE